MKTQRILIFYYIAVFLSFFYFKYISLLKNERNPINLKRVNMLKGLETRPFENKFYVYHDNYHLSKKVSIKLNQFISVNGLPTSLSHVESYGSDHQADDFTHSTLEEITNLEKPFIVIVNSSDIETAPSQDQVKNGGSAIKDLDFNLTIKGGNTLIFTLLKNYIYTEQGCERMFALIKRIFLINDYRRLRPTVDVNFVLLSTQGRVYWDFKAMLNDYLNNMIACLSLFHDVNLHSRVVSNTDLYSKLSTTTSVVKVECDSIETVVDNAEAPSILQIGDESNTSDQNSKESNTSADNEGDDDTKGADVDADNDTHGNDDDTNDTDDDTNDTDDDTNDSDDSDNYVTSGGFREENDGNGGEGANENDTETGHNPNEVNSDTESETTATEGNTSDNNANVSNPDEVSSEEDNSDTTNHNPNNSDTATHNTTTDNTTDSNNASPNRTNDDTVNSGEVKSDTTTHNTTDPNTTDNDTINSIEVKSDTTTHNTTDPNTTDNDTINSIEVKSDTTTHINTDAIETDDGINDRIQGYVNKSKPTKVTTKKIVKEVEHVTVELNTEFYNFFEALGNVDVAIKDNHYYRNSLNFYLVLTDKQTFIKDPMTEERRQSFTIENLGVFLFTTLEELRAGSDSVCGSAGSGRGSESAEGTHVLSDSEITQVLSSWVTHVRHLYDLPATKSEFVLSLANPDENMRAESDDKYVLSSKSDIELKFGVQFQDPVGMAFYGFEVHKMAKSLVFAYAKATFENLAKLEALTKVSYNTQVPKSTAQHANNSMDALEYLMGTKELDDTHFNQMDKNQTLLLVAKYAFLESLEALSDDQMFNKNVLSYEHQLAVFMCDVFPFAFPVLVYMLKLLTERMKNR